MTTPPIAPIHHVRQACVSTRAFLLAEPLSAPTIGPALEALEEALSTMEANELSFRRRCAAAALGITAADL